MSTVRRCALIFVLLLGADYVTPSQGGAFSLARADLFIDAVLRHLSTPRPANLLGVEPEPRLPARLVPHADESVRAARTVRMAVPDVIRGALRSHIKRGAPISFALASPEDH